MKLLIMVLMLVQVVISAEFDAFLTLQNVTGTPVSIIIKPGDLYAATNSGEYVQNVTPIERVDVVLEPYETREIQLRMACIDPDRPAPSPGHTIAPSGFEFPGEPDQEEIRQKIQNIINSQVYTEEPM